jgi:ubiquinol-cytochrome c reductase cytochrome b subunit
LVIDFLILGWLGQKPVEAPYIVSGQVATVFYFLFFLVLLPFSGILESYLMKIRIINE